MSIAVLFLIFVHASTATPYLNNVIVIRRQLVVVRRGHPFGVYAPEVDILTLCDAGLTAHAQRWSHAAYPANTESADGFLQPHG